MGRLPDGTQFTNTFPVQINDTIPVDKVFVKQRLEIMTAQFWLEQDNQIKNELVELSVMESVPTPHTTMVCFVCNDQKHQNKHQIHQNKRQIYQN